MNDLSGAGSGSQQSPAPDHNNNNADSNSPFGKFVKFYREMWRKPKWADLDHDAQWIYMSLISQENITLAGVLPLQLTKWSKHLASDLKPEVLADYLTRLDNAGFTVTDFDTEEVLAVAYMRTEVIQGAGWKIQKGAINKSLLAESPAIRTALADQLDQCLRLQKLKPEAHQAALDAIEHLKNGRT